jgi:hypothetical protein|tara:strand:+ start:2915 stop:3808 length:894 start_codon:yes stop_codon:yes gene_type:complete
MANIFKKIGKSLKKAAPLIGAGLGFYFGGGAGLGTALGAGIGSLAAGGDIEDALMAGALGYGAGSLAQGYLPSAGQAATKGIFMPSAGAQAVSNTAATQVADIGIGSQVPITDLTKDTSILGGIGNFMADNKLLTAGLGLGALGMLAGGEEEEQQGFRYPDTGPGRAYETKVKGPITGTTYNLANEDEVEAYNDELLMLREKDFRYKDGGEVYTGNGNIPETYLNKPGGELKGPGTGTSDSIRVGVYDSQGNYQGPGGLSDGEFILTAKSVRGAGNGDRDIGAARMYDMMAELESMA